MFNHADTLLLIYGDTASHWYVYDCTLCAANIMLAAHSMGIGSCWLGFGEHVLDTPEFKRAHNVPGSYSLVCPMSLGYSKGKLPPSERRDPWYFPAKGLNGFPRRIKRGSGVRICDPAAAPAFI